MSRIYISEFAGQPLKEYLLMSGHTVNIVRDKPLLGLGVGSHPDLTICKAGVLSDSPVICSDGIPGSEYPQNAAYCAVFLDRYLIHRLDITAPDILKYAEDIGLTSINVRQGYTKCSTVVVDGCSVISSDLGIINALASHPDINVLAVKPGHVRLSGFEYGFLGGASGRVGHEVIFNGDLSAHPDFLKICAFIESRGLSVKYFPEYELTDIGSIIEYDPKKEGDRS